MTRQTGDTQTLPSRGARRARLPVPIERGSNVAQTLLSATPALMPMLFLPIQSDPLLRFARWNMLQLPGRAKLADRRHSAGALPRQPAQTKFTASPPQRRRND